jgi:hypothetical protein
MHVVGRCCGQYTGRHSVQLCPVHVLMGRSDHVTPAALCCAPVLCAG